MSCCTFRSVSSVSLCCTTVEFSSWHCIKLQSRGCLRLIRCCTRTVNFERVIMLHSRVGSSVVLYHAAQLLRFERGIMLHIWLRFERGNTVYISWCTAVQVSAVSRCIAVGL